MSTKERKRKQPQTVRRYGAYTMYMCLDWTCCDLFRLYNKMNSNLFHFVSAFERILFLSFARSIATLGLSPPPPFHSSPTRAAPVAPFHFPSIHRYIKCTMQMRLRQLFYFMCVSIQIANGIGLSCLARRIECCRRANITRSHCRVSHCHLSRVFLTPKTQCASFVNSIEAKVSSSKFANDSNACIWHQFYPHYDRRAFRCRSCDRRHFVRRHRLPSISFQALCACVTADFFSAK